MDEKWLKPAVLGVMGIALVGAVAGMATRASAAPMIPVEEGFEAEAEPMITVAGMTPQEAYHANNLEAEGLPVITVTAY